MLPMSIMSAQMGKGVPMQPHVPSSGGGRSSGSMNKISKMPQSFMTRDQAREFRRAR
jgi:hypothetical protein